MGQVPDANLLTWADAQPRTGAFGINPTVTTEGVPAVGWYNGFLEVKQSGRRLTLTESSGQYRTWTNCTSSNQWAGWKPQALAVKPQEFNLPLTEEVLAPAKYCKTQFGMVWLYINVLKQDDGAFSSGEQIGTLPAGFRPLYTVYTPAVVCATGGGVREIGEIAIFNDGRVMFYCPTNATATNLIRGIAIFLASD